MTTLGWFFIIAGVVWLGCAVAVVAIFHTDAANDEVWEAERSERPVADPEWLRDLADDPTPTFTLLRDEQGLGPIFEEGYQRQAKRLGSELSDPAAVDAWLAGGER